MKTQTVETPVQVVDGYVPLIAVDHCAALDITGWSMPGPTGFRSFQVSAFIGYPNRSNRRETNGGNVHFTVYVHSSH